MSTNPGRISALIIKHLDGQLLASEKLELDQWLAISEKEQQLFAKLIDSVYVQEELEKFYAFDAEAGWHKIQTGSQIQPQIIEMPRPFRWKYWVAAAVLLIIVGSGVFSIFQPKKGNEFTATDIKQPKQSPNVAPPVSKATITLGDGSIVLLDSVNGGVVTVQDNITIRKTPDGQILYDNRMPAYSAIQFNTLNNPRGSKVIQLTLNDGTRVWLNAESAIRYPVAFTANKRNVEVWGEAYFEVAKDAAKPFFVKTNSAEIQVTGTHFNVNAYANESSVKVTLLEGAVKVSGDHSAILLEPGQQVQVTTQLVVNRQIDIDEVMAWKNGLFNFKGADIYSIMRQLSRWYDVDIQIKDPISEQFYGEISRNTNAADVLHMLEITGSVHFKTNGKTIEVSK